MNLTKQIAYGLIIGAGLALLFIGVVQLIGSWVIR
jgi:hypothetical protein